MTRPCLCGRALKGEALDKFDDTVPADKKQCVFCWNALNDPAYQRLWGLDEFGEALTALASAPKLQLALLAQAPRSCCG